MIAERLKTLDSCLHLSLLKNNFLGKLILPRLDSYVWFVINAFLLNRLITNLFSQLQIW